ncbi:hypothetical protein A0H81_06860 [Grifola frondosa]|uniref:Uncharacterized protein n=1 Tax=Grifola frondosa TaxID=5627 RepID=A0A1C7M946_GRIFR|nr:hypothetical protein A0H81_06860 [Grifola frondosa]
MKRSDTYCLLRDQLQSKVFHMQSLDVLGRCLGNRHLVILELCVDRKAGTARKRSPVSLASLLNVDDGPEWHRYDGGTFTPWDGELFVIPHDNSDYSDSEEEYGEEYDKEEYDEGGLDVVEEIEEKLANEKGSIVASDNVEYAGDKVHAVVILYKFSNS